jgi:hypothetical protein
MNAQVKSQILGLTLAVSTAIGCIAYEKIVKNFSLSTVVFLAAVFYIPLMAGMFLWDYGAVSSDIKRLAHDSSLRWYGIVYMATWITFPLWFMITKNQDVMVGSIYEVKYIVILAVFYMFMGSRPMTLSLATGLGFALLSIYFISKK